MAPREDFLASTSSEMRATLGLVWRATSRPMWEADRPMSLMKCQYLRPARIGDSLQIAMMPRTYTSS